MLKKAFITAVLTAATLPMFLYGVMASMLDSLSETLVREQIESLLKEGTNRPFETGGGSTYIPDFRRWKAPADVPAPFRRPLPRRMARWLKFQSPGTVKGVFSNAFAEVTLPEKEEPAPDSVIRQWRVIAHAACGGLLADAVELTLNKGLLDGVEACLRLPGPEYFIEHAARAGRRDAYLLEIEALRNYRDGFEAPSYPDQPWFMKWSGGLILDVLRRAKVSGLDASIAGKMHEALDGWEPPLIRPWLPLAYFCACPSLASPEVLERYLRRVLEGKECPYMLNAAALFLYRAGEDRIDGLLEDLEALAAAAGQGDLEQEAMKDPVFLYWFVARSAPELRPRIPAAAARALEGREVIRPRNLDLIAEMWKSARAYAERERDLKLVADESFFLLMKGLYPENAPRSWFELGVIPRIHGHCFMAL